MIELKELRKSYKTGTFEQKALDGVSLALRDNEFVAVLGPSGSGKTTLLNVLGGLDHADSGDIVVNGTSTKDYKSADWDTYRNHRIGFIFQSYNLIPHQSVLSNVELALTLAGVPGAERKARAARSLERVGLGEHVNKKPSQLSGGQMQRVAIARALVNDPNIVLADEPTGALDTETGIAVMNLLAEIAQDRLVVMVTHNPELAEQYATRIVRLADGRIVSDSDPLDVSEGLGEHAGGVAAAASGLAEPAGGGVRAKGKRARMSFLTALGLSFNNLMTKKGRTFMTAFAGSIGIIGIAAILSLSNGVNNYIANTEEQALTSYPLTITKSSFDFSGLLGSSMGIEADEGDEEELSNFERGLQGMSNSSEQVPRLRTGNKIAEVPMMTDMFAQVKSNNLSAFKKYLDSGSTGIDDFVHTVQYSYGIVPQVFKVDTSDGVVRLNPSSMGNMLTGGLDASAFGISGTGSEVFNEMMDNRELLENYMDVVAGRWPENYDECALVLSSTGRLMDYTLYSIGYYDPEVMEQMAKDALDGSTVTAPETAQDFTLEKALGMEFSVVANADMYEYNADQNIWSDISGDDEKMKQRIDEGIRLKVVGVLQPSPDVNSIALPQGIAYTPDLTTALMERSAGSAIVKQQQGKPSTDVFTGESFDDLRDSKASDFDFESMFDVDEDALKAAFSFDSDALDFSQIELDESALSLDPNSVQIDPNAFQIDSSALQSAFGEDAFRSILASAPQLSVDPSDFAGSAESLSSEQQQALGSAANALATDFMAWALANNRLSFGGFDAQAAQDAQARAAAAVQEAQQDQAAVADRLAKQAEEAAAAARQAQEAAAAAQQAQGGATDADAAAAAAQQAQEAAAASPQEQGSASSADAAAAAAQQVQAEAVRQAQEARQRAQALQDQANQTNQGNQGGQAGQANQVDFAALFQEYLQTDSAQNIMQPLLASVGEEAGAQAQELVGGVMQNYLQNQFAPYLASAMQQMAEQAGQLMGMQIASAMQDQMAQLSQTVGSSLSAAISGQLQSQMSKLQDVVENGFSFDADTFAGAIKFTMSQDDLASLLSNLMNADSLSFEGNLKKLGYAQADSPESVSIYPVDFQAKEAVLRIIDDYNARMKAEGRDDEAIQYSDFAGVLMSSVTNIIDAISLVLIAFVSISLVVSSIMISIITYISVLERKKEIGILRAMGASKGNIANVFNAETIIEGLIAGLLAIAVVLSVSVPVNRFVEAGWGVPHVMSLPAEAAVVLVAISVLLTFLAGLVPSQAASRRDPVEALRAE